MTSKLIIHVPKYTEYEVNVPTAPVMGLQGFYKLEALKDDGRVRPLTDWFPNIITNKGIDIYGVDNIPVGICVVGTGNATPLVTDVSLQTQLALVSNNVARSHSAVGSSPYYTSMVHTHQFGFGAATGNLSEVGIGTGATSLFSRALILDGGGTPTTITVLSNEALSVTYELRQYVPLTDVTGTINIGGVNYNYTLRASSATNPDVWGWEWNPGNSVNVGPASASSPNFAVTSYNGSIGAITSGPGGSQNTSGSPTNSTYSNGTGYYDTQWNWAIGDANFGVGDGIKSIRWQCGYQSFIGSAAVGRGRGAYQIDFGAKIPKDNTKILQLGIRHAWARRP